MQIDRGILIQHFHQAVSDQVKKDYESKGYSVCAECSLGDYRADLVAKNDHETVVIEIKSGSLSPEKRELHRNLREYVRSQGDYRFVVIYASPPRDKDIEIDKITEILHDILINDMPNNLDELSTHTSLDEVVLDEVVDVDLDQIHLKSDNTIRVEGTGTVGVELQFGSGSDNRNDDGHITYATFQMNFSLDLVQSNGNLDLKEIIELEIDTTSWYQ
ncbi:MAG: hypothetical protein HQ568_02940 [Calditrichaeota bacterium]|nr:hypothetical protein [Calditrichota bacterium]